LIAFSFNEGITPSLNPASVLIRFPMAFLKKAKPFQSIKPVFTTLLTQFINRNKLFWPPEALNDRRASYDPGLLTSSQECHHLIQKHGFSRPIRRIIGLPFTHL
jgi:hypothetical protein